ncbi:MAG: hypothetical protein VW976_09515, partial [Flavobacteriaceae bacterium]
MLFVELIASLYPLFNDVLSVKKFEFSDTGYIKGITGNKNITAASICLKIPFLMMLINTSKSFYFRIPLVIILTLALLNLFFLSSRATYLSLILIFSFYFLEKIIYEIKGLGLFKFV